MSWESTRRRRALLERPLGVSVRTSTRALTAMFVTVGLLLVVVGLVEDAGGLLLALRLGSGVLALGLAAVVHFIGHLLPAWAFWLFHLTQSSLLSVGVAFSPEASMALAWSTLFVLLLIESFFVLSWLEAGIEFGIAAGLLSWALLGHTDVGIAPFTILVGVLAATCAVTGWLVRAMAQAESDALTGVLNRRGLQRRIAEALRSAPEGSPVVVALIDLDHFKTVNDTQGHAAGDLLLRRVADAALLTLPSGVSFARWGGDEFALLSVGRETSTVQALVAELRAALPAGAGMSVGIAAAVRGGDQDALLAAADEALYAVKRAGRGATYVHGPDMPPTVERRHR